MNNQALKGRTALVTGASQGIGLACARALAEDGATVVIMGRGEATLTAAGTSLIAEVPGSRIEMFIGDAGEEDQVKAALDFAHGLSGRLDILVSTVGAPTYMPLLMRDLDGVRKEMDINFTTAFLLVRHGVPLLPRNGAIVCVSSIVVTQANWGLSIYSAAKAALERFVRAAAYELGGAGIRINAVRPGPTLAPERARQPELAEMVKVSAANTPLGRLGEPDDIARVVRFLAGPESGWVTGQTFSADGGMDQNSGPDFMDAFFGRYVMDRIRAGKPVDQSQ